ncbi:MAG: hypothetical protein KJN64_10630 [Ignavibacteria bacterium]|nr:hypothetical protein [Ignavibacteria bacterium]MBT8382653.1 hypothetical protein [Ignavibacteria bacterium]MBT8391232.1 hypothetical protein [Ignavibacteria bacterium]NNJ54421.1 hypothetical protein [Ignavibacteriaceae bacterium]NNL22459.1 hypothetical protein [Ignavibacteriaceae bacterium]
MKFFVFLFTTILLVFFFSCGRKEYTEQGILETKAEIDSLLHNPEAEEYFDWGSAKAYSNFRAYFHQSKLIFINEDFRHRYPGESFNRYYFKDGNFLYFIGKELTYNPQKVYNNVEMMIDPDGNVLAYDKMVNGERIGLSNEEIGAILEHAEKLRDVVYERSEIVNK